MCPAQGYTRKIKPKFQMGDRVVATYSYEELRNWGVDPIVNFTAGRIVNIRSPGIFAVEYTTLDGSVKTYNFMSSNLKKFQQEVSFDPPKVECSVRS